MNPEQLEQLLVEHGAPLRLFAASFCCWPDDCVQQAFIKLTLEDPPPANPVAWLFRVVRNEAFSIRRAERRRFAREARAQQRREDWFCGSPTDEIDTEKLTAALENLDEEKREVVVARIWGNLKFEEIAELAGCSTSAAHRRFQSALDELRNTMNLIWLVTGQSNSV